jgi:hypothetical protein
MEPRLPHCHCSIFLAIEHSMSSNISRLAYSFAGYYLIASLVCELFMILSSDTAPPFADW